jgi:hypothetical protein
MMPVLTCDDPISILFTDMRLSTARRHAIVTSVLCTLCHPIPVLHGSWSRLTLLEKESSRTVCMSTPAEDNRCQMKEEETSIGIHQNSRTARYTSLTCETRPRQRAHQQRCSHTRHTERDTPHT